MRPDSGRGFLFFGVRELAPAFPPSPHSSYGEKPPQSATRGRKKSGVKPPHSTISLCLFFFLSSLALFNSSTLRLLLVLLTSWVYGHGQSKSRSLTLTNATSTRISCAIPSW